ncbi:hypothetical protein D9619_009370 [Psilocybe cf. subviscida]|uniref:Uncharacterized protein n=1 Tax=Psilocybe cf. subviscida TaxID=2480587 RepID=A0A8H5BTG7_9AGAR|nr:hypothetical protein D9619_009370 [Psilocybe cf. subviscida]
MSLSESEHTHSAYIFVGTTSVFLWDILCHLRDDYHIVARHRISFPTVAYFISRLFTSLYLIGRTVISTRSLEHCNLAIRIATSPLILGVSASELLLFLHVRAIYAKERVVVWFFSILWLVTVANVIFAVVVISGTTVESTTFCVPVISAGVGVSLIGVHMLNDTLLFAALVWRILRTSSKELDESRLKDSIKTVLFGDYVPRLAKALLQNGQQYFLSSILIHIAALILYFSQTGNVSLGFPSIMLMSLMSSRLYRKTKLAPIYDSRSSFKLTDPQFKAPSAIAFAGHSLHTGAETELNLNIESQTTSV